VARSPIVVKGGPIGGTKLEVELEAHLAELLENVLAPAVVFEYLIFADEAGAHVVSPLVDFHGAA
jgi:hypothetical protein